MTYCRGNATLKGVANFWPTPRTEGHDAGAHRGNPDSLHAAVKLFPTPDATGRPHEGNVRLLRAKVLDGEMTEDEATAMLGKSPFESQGKIPAMLPTPQAFDANDINRSPEALARAKEIGGCANLRETVSGKLCAAWVSRMMGFPDGWLDVSGSSTSDGTAIPATPSGPSGKTASPA